MKRFQLIPSLIVLATITHPIRCHPCAGTDCPSQSIGSSVKTSSGVIIGHPGPQYPDVTEYLGIPFATPPIGQLRFAAPVKLQSGQTVIANNYV